MLSACGETITLFGTDFRIVEVSVSSSAVGGLDYVDLRLMGDSRAILRQSLWVPCDEKLPRDDAPVLCARDGSVREAVYWGPEDGWSISPDPEFWMPMPEGP